MHTNFLPIILNTSLSRKSTLVGDISKTSSHILHNNTWGYKPLLSSQQPIIFKNFFYFVSFTATHKPQSSLYFPKAIF